MSALITPWLGLAGVVIGAAIGGAFCRPHLPYVPPIANLAPPTVAELTAPSTRPDDHVAPQASAGLQ